MISCDFEKAHSWLSDMSFRNACHAKLRDPSHKKQGPPSISESRRDLGIKLILDSSPYHLSNSGTFNRETRLYTSRCLEVDLGWQMPQKKTSIYNKNRSVWRRREGRCWMCRQCSGWGAGRRSWLSAFPILTWGDTSLNDVIKTENTAWHPLRSIIC